MSHPLVEKALAAIQEVADEGHAHDLVTALVGHADMKGIRKLIAEKVRGLFEEEIRHRHEISAALGAAEAYAEIIKKLVRIAFARKTEGKIDSSDDLVRISEKLIRLEREKRLVVQAEIDRAASLQKHGRLETN
jgi:hypothetical protein